MTCIFLFFLLFGCASNTEQYKIYAVNLYYGNQYSETYNFYSGDTIYLYEFDLPNSLVENYYIEGWFYDSNYTNNCYNPKVRSNLKIYAKLGVLKDASEYTYGKGVNKKKIIDYFKSSGEYITINTTNGLDKILALIYKEDGYGTGFYRIKESGTSNSYNLEKDVIYFPEVDKFITTCSNTEMYKLGNLKYSWKYEGKIEYCIEQNICEAKYDGTFIYMCFDNYSYSSQADYTVKFDFEPKKVKPDTLRFGSFYTSKYTYKITDATNYDAAQRHFNEIDYGKKCYSCFFDCLNFIENIYRRIDLSYKPFQ